MKSPYLFLLIVLSCSFTSNKSVISEELNQFNIIFSKPDSELKSNESRIEFKIGTNRGLNVSDSILMSYNGTKATLHPNTVGRAFLNLPPGKYVFQFYFNPWHSEIYSDSTTIVAGHLTGIQLVFDEVLIEVKPAKPVIYIYPETTEYVSVKLDVHGQLGFTYPAYNEGWNFVAQPNGKIEMNGREYDYLFWDGVSTIDSRVGDLKNGFIVQKDSLTIFFEEKLTAMGLNEREIEDYITYWCPLLQVNEYSYVHFLFNEECNLIANMNIFPEPNNTNRVYMLWSNAAEISASTVFPQAIPQFNREGFDALEWGGTEVSNLQELL